MKRNEATVVLNRSLPLPKEGLPEWIPLVTSGEVITGRDGRQFRNPGASVIQVNQERWGLDPPVDVEHATELKGPLGEPAPAMGWITDYRLEGNSLLGKVEWNAEGKSLIESRAYRYYSPTYGITPGEGEIVFIRSVGLTNVPNLTLPSLNREENKKGGGRMKFPVSIITALGLSPEATEAEVLSAIEKSKVKVEPNAVKQDLVPKADYQLVLNRAEAAEKAVAEHKAAEFKVALNRALDEAQKAGKIAPSSRAYYEGTVKDSEGLKKFQEFAKDAPAVVATDPQVPSGNPPETQGGALSADEEEVAEALGYSKDEYQKLIGKGAVGNKTPAKTPEVTDETKAEGK